MRDCLIVQEPASAKKTPLNKKAPEAGCRRGCQLASIDHSKPARMIGLPAGTRIWFAAGITDMRSDMNGLASCVETTLTEDPYSVQQYRHRMTSQ